jgi:hypothetical protein
MTVSIANSSAVCFWLPEALPEPEKLNNRKESQKTPPRKEAGFFLSDGYLS